MPLRIPLRASLPKGPASKIAGGTFERGPVMAGVESGAGAAGAGAAAGAAAGAGVCGVAAGAGVVCPQTLADPITDAIRNANLTLFIF